MKGLQWAEGLPVGRALPCPREEPKPSLSSTALCLSCLLHLGGRQPRGTELALQAQCCYIIFLFTFNFFLLVVYEQFSLMDLEGWRSFKTSLSHYIGKLSQFTWQNICFAEIDDASSLILTTMDIWKLTPAQLEPEISLQAVLPAFVFLQMISYFANAVNQKTFPLCTFIQTGAHLTAGLVLILRTLQTNTLLGTFSQYTLRYFNYFIWC